MKKIKPIIPIIVSILYFTYENNALAQQIKIGTQIWATKNLEVSNFRNGEPIPEARTDAEWEKAWQKGNPAWCYYDNDLANGAKYGKLYNWYAVNDPRGLAPKGWHIPSNEEWTTLTDNLGGKDVVAGTKMKSSSGWKDNRNGSNSSGFAGLPGGFRGNGGAFSNVGANGFWWSSSESITGYAWNRFLYDNNGGVGRGTYDEHYGFSVRCLGD